MQCSASTAKWSTRCGGRRPLHFSSKILELVSSQYPWTAESVLHSNYPLRTERLWHAGLLPSRGKRFLGTFAKLRKATISFVMSACLSAWNNSAPTGRIFIKFGI
jgi:hypothetical protein